MEKIKLAALDIDGTLLDSKNELRENVKNTVRLTAEAGIEVVISTGRAHCEMDVIFSNLPCIRYHILANGAYIYDAKRDEIIYTDSIPSDTVREVWERSRDFSAMMEIFADEKIYTQKTQWRDSAYYNAHFLAEAVPHSRTLVESMPAFVEERSESVDKINLFFHDYSDCDRAIARCAELALTPVVSANQGLEFNNQGVCKGKALRALCKILAIDPSQTFAMGDGESDISMLELASIAVTPANAADEVKAHASVLSPSCDEEGAAWALKKYILNLA